MRFNVIWLDDDGYAKYAEHFENPTIDKALRFISRKFVRRESVRQGVSGFIVSYADSEFIRRYTTRPGTIAKTLCEPCEILMACAGMQHLIRPG